MLTLGITPGMQQQKASSAMPVADLPPLRLYLELTAERVATLKVNHRLRPEAPAYARFFLECHVSRELAITAARDFAARHAGDAIEVVGGPTQLPLLTVSIPLADSPTVTQVASLASDLLQAVEASILRV